jgi:hypothetical protein
MTSFPQFVPLTRAQENALLDAIIGQLEKCGNQHLAAMPQSERYGFIAQQIEKARKLYRIDKNADILLFCAVALAGGTGFDREPCIARVLTRVLEEDITFGRAYWLYFAGRPVPRPKEKIRVTHERHYHTGKMPVDFSRERE